MKLQSPELRGASKVSADWPEGRQLAPDRTGSVRGLTKRSFHRIAFTDWGPASAVRPVVCVHGLTRNGRDFDHLAAALVDDAVDDRVEPPRASRPPSRLRRDARRIDRARSAAA